MRAADEAQVLAVDELAAADAHDPDEHRRVVGHAAEAGLAFAELVLDLLELADVEVDADPGDDVAVVVAHRHAAGEHGTPSAVDAAEPVLDVPRQAGADALLPRGERLLDVVGMQDVGPAEPGALLLRQADELQERLAAVDVAALGVADPDAVVDRLADGAVHALAVAEGFLGALVLGDVGDGADVAGDLARRRRAAARRCLAAR